MINAECNYFDLVFLINHTLLVKVELSKNLFKHKRYQKASRHRAFVH